MVSLCAYYLAYALAALGDADLVGMVWLLAWDLMMAAVVLTVVSGASVLLECQARRRLGGSRWGRASSCQLTST